MSGIVWALFPLRGPVLTFMGFCGLLWASSGPMRGVVGVVQPADVVTNLRNGPISKMENFSKKKTHLRPKRHVWRHLGPFSSLWACVGLLGCCGPLWAFINKLYI